MWIWSTKAFGSSVNAPGVRNEKAGRSFVGVRLSRWNVMRELTEASQGLLAADPGRKTDVKEWSHHRQRLV